MTWRDRILSLAGYPNQVSGVRQPIECRETAGQVEAGAERERNRSVSDIDARIRAAEQDEAAHLAAAREAKNLARSLSCEKFGITVGRILIFKGKRYAVHGLHSYFGRGEKPWLDARPIKKDGTPADQRRCVYTDWEWETP